MKNLVLSGCVLALAASASAAGSLSTTPTGVERLLSGGYTQRDPGDVVVPISLAGQVTFDLVSDPSNTVLLIDVAAAVGLPSGSAVSMTGIGWDVTIDTLAPNNGSWMNEARLYFDDNIAPDLTGLFLTPGSSAPSVGAQNFSSGGVLDLTDNGIGNILLPNGILRLELHEMFDDVADAVDALFSQGGVTITATPAPGAFGLMGLGGLLMARRRR